MITNNAEKKRQIENILNKYNAQLSELKSKRDSVVRKFIDELKKKRLNEIKMLIK